MGGGIGGLFCGAILAREGFRVTVLDKNRTAGGGLQTFYRDGVPFGTGMHLFGAMGPKGQLRLLCRYLGIEEKLQVKPFHDNLINIDTHTRLTLPFGREGWIDAWCRHYGDSPQLREEISTYVDDLYRLAGQENLFNLRPSEWREELFISPLSAKEFVAQHISNPTLRRDISYLSSFYGGTDDSPALVHALLNVLHIDGTYAFASRSSQLVELLTSVVASAGGRVVADAEVTNIAVDDRHVSHVVTTKGDFTAENFISAIPIGALLRILPGPSFSTAFRHRIASAPLSYSSFTLYATLQPRTLRHSDDGYFFLRNSTDVWSLHRYSSDSWPQMLFLLTEPDPEHPEFARALTMMAPMDYAQCERWEETRTGHRPDDYQQWKQELARQALAMVEPTFGPLQMVHLTTASPLTIRDYYGNTRGAIYGMHTNVTNPLQTMLSTRTKIDNLFLTGQDVNFHGMVGVAVTAIATAETLLGQNTIVDKLNRCR